MEKRTGRKPDATAFVSSRDVQTAKDLLAQLSIARIPKFIDYALTEAGKTRFDLQTLGGVRQYLPRYLELQKQRGTNKAVAEAGRVEERQTQLRMDYNQYRRDKALRLFDNLPAIEQASIEALARSKLSSKGPIPAYMTQTLTKLEKLRLTVERYPGGVLDFAQWSASRSA